MDLDKLIGSKTEDQITTELLLKNVQEHILDDGMIANIVTFPILGSIDNPEIRQKELKNFEASFSEVIEFFIVRYPEKHAVFKDEELDRVKENASNAVQYILEGISLFSPYLQPEFFTGFAPTEIKVYVALNVGLIVGDEESYISVETVLMRRNEETQLFEAVKE